MSETDNSTQGQKPKTSKLAIVSVLIPFVSFVGSLCFIVLLRSKNMQSIAPFFFPFLLLGGYPSLVTFMIAIYALIKIKKSRGLLRGYVFSTLGILMSVLAFHCAMRGIGSIRPEAQITHCGFEMIEIGKALQVYSNDYNNHYPPADKWCDLLIEHTDIEETVFDLAAQEWWRNSFHYAINPKCEPNSPGDIVLLFETKGGWNQFGGPELLTTDNHMGKGCNVLFNDGHVEFMSPERFEGLKWGDKE